MFRVLTVHLKQAIRLHLMWVAMSTLPERLIPLLSWSIIQAVLGPTATPQQEVPESVAMLSLTVAIALARALQEHLERLATVTPYGLFIRSSGWLPMAITVMTLRLLPLSVIAVSGEFVSSITFLPQGALTRTILEAGVQTQQLPVLAPKVLSRVRMPLMPSRVSATSRETDRTAEQHRVLILSRSRLTTAPTRVLEQLVVRQVAVLKAPREIRSPQALHRQQQGRLLGPALSKQPALLRMYRSSPPHRLSRARQTPSRSLRPLRRTLTLASPTRVMRLFLPIQSFLETHTLATELEQSDTTQAPPSVRMAFVPRSIQTWPARASYIIRNSTKTFIRTIKVQLQGGSPPLTTTWWLRRLERPRIPTATTIRLLQRY